MREATKRCPGLSSRGGGQLGASQEVGGDFLREEEPALRGSDPSGRIEAKRSRARGPGGPARDGRPGQGFEIAALEPAGAPEPEHDALDRVLALRDRSAVL